MSRTPGTTPTHRRLDVTAPEPSVVAAWHEALNAGEAQRLAELSHQKVEAGGPRGTGRGARLLRDWSLGAGIRLVPTRVFHRDGTVVVEQEAEWSAADTGETYERQVVASVFVVRDGLVASVVRYPDLAEAVRAASIDGSGELTVDHRPGAHASGGEAGKL
jgi:ketosteroid isomerase-like protein